MTLKSHWWSDLTALDFQKLDMSKVVAVLPVGATEQHGPHLPVKVDAAIVQGIMEHAVAQMPDDLDVLILPTQQIGKSNEHAAFPGTLTLSAETLSRLWYEICESVYRAGVRKVVFVNAHGGQPQIMDIVCRQLRIDLGMFAVSSFWSRFTDCSDLYCEHERRHGIHAGEEETSVMMYLHPDQCDMDYAENFSSLSESMDVAGNMLLPEGGGVGFGWQMQDLNPKGAVGNAAAADVERGRITVERAAQQFIRLLREVSDYPIDQIKSGPDFGNGFNRKGAL